MQPIKRLWLRMNVLVRAVLADLFGEGDLPGQAAGPARAADVTGPPAALSELEARLNEVRSLAAGLAAGQRQAELEQRRALEALAALDAQIDQAIGEGREDQARAMLARHARLELRMAELAGRSAEQAQAADAARAAAERLKERLSAARQQATDLAGRATSAAALDDLQRLRREMDRDLARLQQDLDHQAEQAARQADRAAAWQDLEKDEPWPH